MITLVISLTKNDPAIGFIAAATIFIITVFLVAKRYISFTAAFLLLLLALIVGIVMSHETAIREIFQPSSSLSQYTETETANFQAQILEAIDHVEKELSIEKDNVQKLFSQVGQIFDLVESEKHKLSQFIEETKQHFQAEAESTKLDPVKEHTQTLSDDTIPEAS